ncbi:MAG: ABC transporter ATP-binding protein [Desulfomonilaceae bacterium]
MGYLELIQIQKKFIDVKKATEIKVIAGIDLCVEKGTLVSIIGPSGCGKTTLLRIVCGLDNSYEGSVFLEGKRIKRPESDIGLVFQQYALFPWRTMRENIEIGLEIMGMPKSQRRELSTEYMRIFGIHGFEDRYPHQLSGGMQQRVAIARTLILDPKIVLMDEPFGSLDSQTRNDMQEFIVELRQRRKDTVLFVTHNVDEAVFLSDRLVILSKRPATVVQSFDIKAVHPRDRTSAEANDIRRQVIHILKQQRLQQQRNETYVAKYREE